MANPWFRFKQFTVQQSQAAFKVGTDACLLGAWVNVEKAQHILDIGTGTGLIALMLAQRNAEAMVTGLEIDQKSAAEARLNFEHSPWNDRLGMIHASLEEFSNSSAVRFDHIVSNPPYFVNSTPNSNSRKDRTRHQSHLPLEHLFQSAYTLATDSAQLSLVLPSDQYTIICETAKRASWFLMKEAFVKPLPEKPHNRVLLTFSKTSVDNRKSEYITLYKEQRIYSDEVTAMLRPFYLFL